MRYPLSPALGLQETTAAGQVPLTFYDEGLNVRDFDERGQRNRSASRSGMLSLGSPCSASSPVTHSFTAKIPTARYEFVEVTTTPDATVTPDQLNEKWSTDLPAEPIDSAITSLGVLILLLEGGDVYEMTDDGTLTLLFSVQIPVNFQLVPSIVVDDTDGIHVAASYVTRIDGNASRFYKYAPDQFGQWLLSVESPVEYVVERFWYDSGDIFCALDRPINFPDGLAYAIGRYGGALTGTLFPTWVVAAPKPVVDMSFRAGAVYITATANSGRPTTSAGGTADVSWTPRELTDADERLYSFLSILRDKNTLGLVNGSRLDSLLDARGDDSDYPDVLDLTTRALTRLDPDRPTEAPIIFAEDPNGNGYEVRQSPITGPSGSIWADSFGFTSQTHTSVMEKAEAIDVASWQRALMPSMGEGEGASADPGARWSYTGLFRIKNTFEDLVATTVNVNFMDWKCIWIQDDWVLRYRATDVTNTTLEVALEYPSLVGGNRSTTFTAGVFDDGEMYLSFTIVNNGLNLAGSFIRMNGVQVGASFSPSRASRTGSAMRCMAHGNFSTNPTGETLWAMDGGMKELCGVLGTTTTNPHDGAPVLGEYERVEGYQCNAHGLQAILLGGHPWVAGPPPTTGDPQPGFDYDGALQQPEGLAVRYERTDGRVRWVYESDAAGNGIVADPDVDSDAVYLAGTPLDRAAATPDRIERIDDNGDTVSQIWQNTYGALPAATVWADMRCDLYVDQCGELYVPFTSVGTTADTEIKKLNPADGAERWAFTVADGPSQLLPGGLFIDDRYKGGACVDQYFYVVCREGEAVKRIELGGRRDTSETRDQITDQIAICESGVVARLADSDSVWEELVSDFTPGGRPWSFELFGQHFFGGPEDYRTYDARRKILREWTPAEGSLIPGRIYIAERWRGRAIVVSEDDRHILYGSAYGDAFDFRTGGTIVTATQAFAGTTAAAGAIPDPVTAVVVANDDLAYVGTTRSVWRLTGDPQTGGQLDDVLASEGILGPYAHTRGDSGELYWMTTALRVLQISGSGLADISTDMIRGRLQSIDRDKYRVEMIFSDREQGVYLLFFPRTSYETEIEHLFWSRRTGRWHPVQFSGGIGRALTSASTLESADAGGWGALWGFADGGLRFVHPEALDDDGVQIASRMRMPIGGDGDQLQSLVTQVEVVLADDQGPVRVVGVSGRTGQTGDDYGREKLAVPGRGNILQLQTAGFNTWVEVIGAGQPWAIDSMAAHVYPWRLG